MLSSTQKKLIVEVSDAKVSKTPGETLATYSLGSCIGVCLYDIKAKAGGMLHYQLPDSKLDAEKAINRPFMFADTGLRLLLQSMQSMGCQKANIKVSIAGGASMRNGPANFEIGKRNYLSIRKCLWKAGLMISAEDVGGSSPRSLFLDISTGTIIMRKDGSNKELK